MNPVGEAMRVLIVEDHGLLAESLAAALRQQDLDVHVAQGMTGDDMLTHAERLMPQLVLLDLDLGSMGSGLDLIAPLRAQGAHVVMLTGRTDRVQLAECVEAGAIGVVGKSVPFDQLVDSIRDSVALGSLMTPHQREELLDELRRQRAADRERHRLFQSLTPREQQVLAALMDGKSAETIATEWVVSMATVRSQIRSLLMKLGVNSQLAAVSLARRADWHPRP